MIDDIFRSKKIILGITGGIAAYKSAFLVRSLINRGAEVRVVMTPSALEFVTPLTLSTLSQNEVIVNSLPSSQKDGASLKTWHIDYAMWADLMIIAPATVNTIAKIVNGFADNALTTLVSALRCPLIIAPAADADMYNNKINLQNINRLDDLGVTIVNAEEGFLASGLSGKGRLADIEKIIDTAEIVLLNIMRDLKSNKVLITAGPTYEDIDPVRFIGNRSSGKMGFALAKAAYLRGAEVTLIAGPSHENSYQEITRINVRSAEEMKSAVLNNINEHDIVIMAAAVADFKPTKVNSQKIKKENNFKVIQLTETSDILASISKIKSEKLLIGFALETEDEIENASKKLERKKIDMIVMNSLNQIGAGFEFETNKVTLIKKNNEIKDLPLTSKFHTANLILNEIKLLL